MNDQWKLKEKIDENILIKTEENLDEKEMLEMKISDRRRIFGEESDGEENMSMIYHVSPTLIERDSIFLLLLCIVFFVFDRRNRNRCRSARDVQIWIRQISRKNSDGEDFSLMQIDRWKSQSNDEKMTIVDEQVECGTSEELLKFLLRELKQESIYFR